MDRHKSTSELGLTFWILRTRTPNNGIVQKKNFVIDGTAVLSVLTINNDWGSCFSLSVPPFETGAYNYRWILDYLIKSFVPNR